MGCLTTNQNEDIEGEVEDHGSPSCTQHPALSTDTTRYTDLLSMTDNQSIRNTKTSQFVNKTIAPTIIGVLSERVDVSPRVSHIFFNWSPPKQVMFNAR